ncbi:MAG: dihydroorotate dehydrogenase electron transfer subunit [Tepidisphaeraceae bacterium]|jgi:dihydroorotate dehydrogenase electron transfer subunit
MVSSRQATAQVAANLKLCRDHYRLVLGLSAFPPTRPGQFIQIACCDLPGLDADPRERQWTAGPEWLAGSGGESHDVELTSPIALIRRPFSLAGRRDGDGVELDIIHRVVGGGTQYLAGLVPGDNLNILGPLGNAFALPAPDQFAILVGGGVGIPPMIYLASQLADRRAVAFAGALCRDLIPLTPSTTEYEVAEFHAHGIPAILATDDGSFGFRGLITQALEEFLDGRLAGEFFPAGLRPMIYTCGPEPMMKRVAEIAIQRNIPCQVAAERAMACGMGTCQSCCIRVKKPDPAKPPLPGSDWCYRLTCTDGPIFNAADLLW